MNWEALGGGLHLYRDSCNVYAVEAPEGMVVINAGTGAWLARAGDLPRPVGAVLCTHFFRDHSAGAAPAARAGIPVYAPYWEQEQFADSQGLFQRRETYLIYDNTWDLFAPIEPIPVSRWMMDGETLNVAGLAFRVLPNPGVTLGAVTLLCELRGQRLSFCGELIHSPGKMARLAPLQYDYNDLRGAVNVITAIDLLRAEKPAILLPSLGEPILREADAALAALDRNLRHALAMRPELQAELDAFDRDPLVRVTDHVFRSAFGGGASCWFVLSRSGKALAIDYGYTICRLHWCMTSSPRHRRPLPHGLRALKERFGVDGIDVAVVTHYHDDHLAGIPLLQRLYGTRCWAGANFARILADPAGYNFPCTWTEPIRVEPQPLGVPVRWEEYTFVFEPMSGHTRWSALVCFEADGRRFAATGDQNFWRGMRADERAGLAEYDGSPYFTNWVYRNGTMLDSLHDSCRKLTAWQPEIVLPGHGGAYRTNAAWFAGLKAYADDYADVHARLMPLGPRDTHFEADSRGAWLEPYRTHAAQPADGGELALRAVMRNPLPDVAVLSARLVGPAGWSGRPVRVRAAGRAEVEAEVRIRPPAGTVCRRAAIALELTADARPFGQVAEALVTLGYERF